MTTFTIKGLYLNSERKNPTYFGTLRDCINYVDRTKHYWLHFGDDNIEICVDDYVLAIKECVRLKDDLGEYFEFKDWRIK